MANGHGIARPAPGMVTAVALLSALAAAVPVGAPGGPAVAAAEGITNSGGDARTGWYPDQPALRPSLVSGEAFGRLWATRVRGQVYAQPLVHAGTVLVATEANEVALLDLETGRIRWRVSLGTPWNPADLRCGDLTPSIGVTGTLVIDPATNTAYLTHKTYVGGAAAWLLDAIDLATGRQRPGFPVPLGGTADNLPGLAFDPKMHLQRPGLLLMGGVVYAAFGSHCGLDPHQGWVFGVAGDGTIRARWAATPTTGAGIWQTGTGLMSDGPGRIFLATGNGSSPPPGLAGGEDTGGRYGNAVVRLGVQPDGRLRAEDFFSPAIAALLDWFNGDLGSGGVVALPERPFGSATYPRLAVAGGKAGYLYLLNRDRLGGIARGPGGDDDALARVGPIGAIFSRAGVWPGDGGWVYVVTTTTDPTWPNDSQGRLQAFAVGHAPDGRPTLARRGMTGAVFGFGSGAPVVTSGGTRSGSALLWTLWLPSAGGKGAELRAYDPVPRDGALRLLRREPIGTGSKFSTPGVGAGRIVVGTRDGRVIAFGRLASAALRVARPAFDRAGRLVVRGSLTRSAVGSVRISARVRVGARWSRVVSARVPIRAGRFRGTLRVPANARGVRVRVAYPGGDGVRPARRTVTVARGTVTVARG